MQKLAIKYGVMYSVISMVVTLLLWATDTLLTMWWVSILASIVVCVLVLRALLKEAKPTLFGGNMSFGEGFKVSFASMVVATVVLTAFTFVFFQFLYTGFKQDQIQMTVEAMGKYNLPQEDIDKAISRIEGQGIGTQLLNSFLTGLISGAIFSAIMAAVMKTPKPVEE
ncbi:MAG: DUF4199 domain-containing protein [Bacteroidia bacterium]|nr:DUF4199 domain-containing protein [Bacteroidia bacterium]